MRDEAISTNNRFIINLGGTMSNYSLIGIDGNAFSVMGYVTRAMRKEGKSKEEIDEYRAKAMSGDYNNLLLESQEVIDELNGGN